MKSSTPLLPSSRKTAPPQRKASAGFSFSSQSSMVLLTVFSVLLAFAGSAVILVSGLFIGLSRLLGNRNSPEAAIQADQSYRPLLQDSRVRQSA